MKIAIAQDSNGVHVDIARHLERLGVEVVWFNIHSAMWADEVKAIDPEVDAYFWNSNDKGRFYYVILDRVFALEQMTGKPVFPDSRQYFFYNDKISQRNFFSFHSLPMPDTFVANKKDAALAYCQTASYPFVLKDAHSASALGVFLIKDREEAEAIVERIFSPAGYKSTFGHFYAQRFVSGLDRDLRIVTLGHKAIASYWRVSENDWRKNVGLGATIESEGIPAAAIELAEKCSRLGGFHWMAFDIVMEGDKPLLLEFSPNFGTKGPEQMGIDVREMQAKYMKDSLES
jgi:ribosomal protein S6--L-glutamate ligase